MTKMFVKPDHDLDYYVKPCSQAPFWRHLKGLLMQEVPWASITAQCNQFFKVGNGAPKDHTLRNLVNWMMRQKDKTVPADFVSFWHDRKKERDDIAEAVVRSARVEATETTMVREANPLSAHASVALTVAESATSATGAIVTAQIAGLPLEVVENEWVTLRSVFEPFGKETTKQVERLGEWANLRKVRLSFRSGAEKRAGNLPDPETWTIHHEHVAMAIAELDTRGMSAEIKASFVRFKRECAAALAAYFTTGIAVNPRAESMPEWARSLLEGLSAGVASASATATTASQRAEKALASVADIEARVDAKLAAVDAWRANVEELVTRPTLVEKASTKYVSVPFSAVDRSDWRTFAEVATANGLPTVGFGAKLIHDLVASTGLVLVEHVSVQSNGRATSTWLMSPTLQEAIVSLAARAVAGFAKWGWEVFHGRLVWKDGKKPARRKEWALESEVLPSMRAPVKGEKQARSVVPMKQKKAG